MANGRSRTARNRRINLRTTPREEKLIHRGAASRGVSVTEFIVDSACLQAEHVLADQREFVATPKQWEAFTRALDRPARIKPELARLFSESDAARRGHRK
jgi:uncharacterized protein (DUF1778 family)